MKFGAIDFALILPPARPMLSAMDKPKPRQWVIDSDDPYIERTPAEAAAYFKRRREAHRAKMAARTPEDIATLQKNLHLSRKGHLDA